MAQDITIAINEEAHAALRDIKAAIKRVKGVSARNYSEVILLLTRFYRRAQPTLPKEAE